MDSPSHRSPPNAASLVALFAGAAAAILTVVQIHSAATIRPLDLTQAIGVLVVLAGSLLADRRSGRRFDAARTGLRLAAAAICAAGVVEQPPWSSIESFGASIAFPWLVLAAFAAFLVMERRAEPAAAGLIAYVTFSAFGGPFFVRDGDEFHSLFALLSIAAVAPIVPCLAASRARGAGLLRETPFVPGLAALAALCLVPLILAADRDRHLEGFVRLLTALAPVALFAAARDRFAAIRATVSAFAAALALGVLASIAAVLEGGLRFEFAHALRVRLPLFGEHPNIVSPYFAVAPPLLLALAERTASAATLNRHDRVALRVACTLLAMVAVLALAACGLTRSRAAIGGAALGLLTFIGLTGFAALRRNARFGRLAGSRPVAIGVAMTLVAVILGAGFLLKDRIAAKLVDPSMEFRVYTWKTALAAIEQRPWLGYGFLASEPLMNFAEESSLDGRSKDTHPHMLPLAFALGAGVPAAILFLGLLAALILRTAAAGIAPPAGARGDPETTDTARATAAAVAASAVALIASNLLDQGLALHTLFPLHLGLLFGIGGAAISIVRGARPETRDAEAEGRVGVANGAAVPAPAIAGSRAILAVPAVLAVLAVLAIFVAADRAAARVVERAKIASKHRDRSSAVALTRLATWLDPGERDARLAYADMLDLAGERAQAVLAIQRACELTPGSPYPWERLANLEYDRRNLAASSLALEEARRRDPTGPSASQWSLRIGNIHANSGRREEAVAAIALALRYDYEAASRAGWQQDANREFVIPCQDGGPPIKLTEVLGRNRDLLPAMVAQDPVKARRLATTLVRTLLTFRRFGTARSVIAEYRSLTPVPWLPLEHLEQDMNRVETAELGTGKGNLDPSPPEALAAAVADLGDDSQVFEGVAGQTVTFIDKGRAFAAKGELDAAIAAYRAGLDCVYDIVAEKSYIGIVLDGIFDGYLRKGDLDAARAWFAKDLYFHAKPTERLEIVCRFADALFAGGDAKGALAELAAATEVVSLLGGSPNERAGDGLEAFGAALGRVLGSKDPAIVHAAEDLMRKLERDGPGLVISLHANDTAGRTNEAAERMKTLRRDHPEWLPATWSRKNGN